MIPCIDGEDKKICRICQKEKHISAFHPNKSCSKGVISTCKECYKVRISKWYSDNRAERQAKQNKRNRDRKDYWVNYFGNKCADCGETHPPEVYDFHHIVGKDVNPSKALSWRFERQKEEMLKCILLCANCHRKRHLARKEAISDTSY